MIDVINVNSQKEGRNSSRLPVFSQNEIAQIRGSADFFGLNYYTSRIGQPAEDINFVSSPNPSIARDQFVLESTDNNWPRAKSQWLYSVPIGLRQLLNWIKTQYDNPEVIITENGWSDDGDIYDIARIEYLQGHLKALLDAIRLDNCNVKGYTFWSVIDNFEWMMGYT